MLKWRGTAFRRVWRRVSFVTSTASIVTVVHFEVAEIESDLTPLPFTLIAVALGIFLGFRNNASYDRYWEGRKLWGRMVNPSRTLARQILTLIGPLTDEASMTGVPPRDDAELRELHRDMVDRLVAYVHCVRMHLRDEDPESELSLFLPPSEVAALCEESNRPIAIIEALADRPLKAIATNIEINVRQRLGETDLPVRPRPVRGSSADLCGEFNRI